MIQNNQVIDKSLEDIWKLQNIVLSMQQVEIPTNHFWSNGIYIREMVLTAGTVIIGKVHKQDHFFVLTKGAVQVSDTSGSRTFYAGDVIKATKGTKRAIFALEDSKWLNIHKTNEQDLDKIEDELVELDPQSAFLPGNILKDEFKEGKNITNASPSLFIKKD